MDPSSGAFWAKVGVATACGGLIGLERQLRGKPAGMRTSMLVCIGTTVFVGLGVELQGPNADPTRVLGQVVTGIGFLGAGVILTHSGQVRGMTSAAVIWMLAAVGATIATGQLHGAMALTGVTLGLLSAVSTLERLSKMLRRGVHADDPEHVERDPRPENAASPHPSPTALGRPQRPRDDRASSS